MAKTEETKDTTKEIDTPETTEQDEKMEVDTPVETETNTEGRV